ncbi:phytoene desaturase family protein [Microbulbifer elongatus]|uniref:phytoene desaturase family protein n=1 Tax=Microbulbifer elongatus TaxID=86173 RepID=UPI001E6049F7|nr:NAD(P)/FAD-dependent oxidoreductase [Microbulbifer elongatus]
MIEIHSMKERAKIFADELVVGAGLTGLVYGNVAAAAGKRVVVIDKHTKVGGYATNFARKGEYIFDCSLHKITGFGESGNLENALGRAGLLNLVEFETYEHLTNIFIGKRNLRISAKPDEFVAQLLREFPDERESIHRFIADIKGCGYQNYMIARLALGEYELSFEEIVRGRQLSRITTYDYLCTLFRNRELITLFCAIAINLGVEAYEVDALYFLHFAYTFFFTEKRYVRGSSQALSDTLADEFVRRGGELIVREEVSSLKTDGDTVTGCLSRRYDITAEHTVFTGCPHQIPNLTPPSPALDSFTGKLESLEFGLGAFIVYLGLDRAPSEIGITKDDYLFASTQYLDCADGLSASDERYQHWPLSVSNYSVLDSTYGNVIQLEVLDHQSDWFELDRQSYKRRKIAIAQLLIDRFASHFPDIKKHIRYFDVSTPRTSKKFTNSYGGSSFGYKPIPKRNVRFLQKPPFQGLQFVGTWINGAGYEPAMCLGFTAATIRNRQQVAEGA